MLRATLNIFCDVAAGKMPSISKPTVSSNPSASAHRLLNLAEYKKKRGLI